MKNKIRDKGKIYERNDMIFRVLGFCFLIALLLAVITIGLTKNKVKNISENEKVSGGPEFYFSGSVILLSKEK